MAEENTTYQTDCIETFFKQNGLGLFFIFSVPEYPIDIFGM